MKKILMLVVLTCATFARPCYGSDKIIEGDPKVVDTLSYCLGATMALAIKSDETMSLFDLDIKSFNKGLTEVLLDRPSTSHESAIRTLEHFFSETAATRLVEHAAAYAMDTTAVFKPFINSTERNKVSHALGVMMAGEIKKPIEEESYTVQCYWLCRGIEECYTQKLSISPAAMASFIERMDAKSSGSATPATEAPATPAAVPSPATAEVDVPVLDSLSYCVGAELGMNVKKQLGYLEPNYAEVARGVNGAMVGTTDIAEKEASAMLEEFFSNTMMGRRAEFEKKLEQDSTLVFKPFVSDAERDKISYALGVDVGLNLMNSNFPILPYWVNRAFCDACEDKLIITLEEMQQFTQRYFTVVLPAANAERSAQWLAERAAESGVQKTASGLLYKVVSQGDMTRAAMSDEDVVCVHYVGRKMDGTVFDASRFEWRSKQQQDTMRKNYPSMFDENGKRLEEDKPIEFSLKNVIAGWTEGGKLVGAGGKIILYIPAELAYGERGAGRDIGPNEALEFEVELIDVKPAVK